MARILAQDKDERMSNKSRMGRLLNVILFRKLKQHFILRQLAKINKNVNWTQNGKRKYTFY